MGDAVYSGPFSITSSQVVKAICVRNNFEQSETAVSVFIINQTPVAPSITAQPQNQTAATCSSAAFSVTAVGSAPLTYEWTKDGSIIGGAVEPELMLAAVLPADAGGYTVRAANGAGDITSNTATLTVTGTDDSCNVTYYVYLPTITK